MRGIQPNARSTDVPGMSEQAVKRVHVRGVPTDVIEILRGRAKEKGLPMNAYLRLVLIGLAGRPDVRR